MKAEITIENAQAVVRASSTEQFQLWCLHASASDWQYAPGSARKIDGQRKLPLLIETGLSKVRWQEQSRGSMYQIGQVADRPICVAVSFATIDGIRVCFVDGCAQLVDHKMIDEWIEKAMPQAARHQADAMNWRNALTGLKPDPLPDVPDPPPYVPPPDPPPPGPFSLPESVALTIHGMLIEGATLHAFRSGGGLRVVDIRTPNGGRRYGEHPHLPDAMRILADDCKSDGGRRYDDVYGPIETHYLTGDSTPSDALDRWVLGGRTIDARAVDGQIEVSLRGLEMFKLPDEVKTQVLAGELGRGGCVRWVCDRGFVHESSPMRFANDEPGVSTVVVAASEGRATTEAHCWSSTRRATAPTFVEAANLALAASPEEERK